MVHLIKYKGAVVGTWDPDRTIGAGDGTGIRYPAPLHVRGHDADDLGEGLSSEILQELEDAPVWRLIGSGADPVALIGGQLQLSVPRGPTGRIRVRGVVYEDVSAAVAGGAAAPLAGGLLAAGPVEPVGRGASWAVLAPPPGPDWSVEVA